MTIYVKELGALEIQKLYIKFQEQIVAGIFKSIDTSKLYLTLCSEIGRSDYILAEIDHSDVDKLESQKIDIYTIFNTKHTYTLSGNNLYTGIDLQHMPAPNIKLPCGISY